MRLGAGVGALKLPSTVNVIAPHDEICATVAIVFFELVFSLNRAYEFVVTIHVKQRVAIQVVIHPGQEQEGAVLAFHGNATGALEIR